MTIAEIVFYFIFGWVMFILGIVILKKILSIGKIPVVEILPHEYRGHLKKVHDGNKIQVGKDQFAKFTPQDLIPEHKPLYKFWRLPKRILFLNGITKKIISWEKAKGKPAKGEKEKKILRMFQNWTLNEMKDYHDKTALKSHLKTRKEDYLPLITMILLLALVIICFMGFRNIGAF